MDAERWRGARALFDELVELSPTGRAARLSEVGRTDPVLRDAVAGLLDADRLADQRLGEVEAALLPPSESIVPTLPPDPFGLSGRGLSHFQVIEPLGSGGMGIVYRAEDTRLKRTVALKVPRPEYRLDISAKQRFLREARTAAGLDHPNLCSIYEVGESEEGLPFLAMPLYPGETLRAYLAREGPVPVGEALAIARKVAEGLASAHDAGVVHRDIKPGNVMLLPDGAVRILDFGLAKVQDLTITDSRVQLGTVTYMAPEQVRGAPVDQRTDLWAMGVVLYEMLTGSRPFGGESAVAVAHAVVHEEPVRPSALRGEIPPALDELLATLLRKDMVGRPESAAQVASELAALERGQPLTPRRRSWRRRWTAAGWHRRRINRVLVFAALAVGAAAVLTPRGQEQVTPPAPTDASIAVLPFANLSDDREQEYLSDGITEELTTHLTRVEGLRVAPAAATFRFKGRHADGPGVGKALGVATVLQGSIRREGDLVHLAAQLIDASTGDSLWSEVYARELGDLFALQNDVGRSVLAALRIRLTRPVTARLPSTLSPEAHELYLKGRHFWNQRTEEALVRAESYFRQAVTLDPGYAEAYSGLADIEIAPRAGRPAARFDRAKVVAAKALSLDSMLVETHISMAWINMWCDREWASAKRHLERALELDPDHIWATSWYAAYLAATGRVEESLPVIRRAHDLDPLSHAFATYVGVHYLWLRRETEAAVYFRKALELDPEFFMAHWGLGRVYLVEGRYREALAELEYKGGDFTGLHQAGLVGYAHALAGHAAEARRGLAELRESARRGDYVAPIDPAIIHIGLGETQLALDWLERLVEDRGARTFLIDPIFDPLRSEPRFQRLIRRLGMESSRESSSRPL